MMEHIVSGIGMLASFLGGTVILVLGLAALWLVGMAFAGCLEAITRIVKAIKERI